MNILIIQHVDSEGPAALGRQLVSSGFTLHYARLNRGDSLPGSPDTFAGVVSMGGPMNVYEETEFPYLRDETVFLRHAIEAEIPTLGICLGAQMIAKALGARVIKSPVKEVGWGEVSLTPEAAGNPFFWGLPRALRVFQWHGDMFEIPVGAVRTAFNADCPNQAFAYRNACGLQYHVEVDRSTIADWFRDGPDARAHVAGWDAHGARLSDEAGLFFRNFLAILKRPASHRPFSAQRQEARSIYPQDLSQPS